MILGDARIKSLVEKEKLLEEYSEKSLEACGYDLRVNKAYRLKSDSFMGVSDRKNPEVEEITDEKITLKPNDYVLIESLEKVNMPDDVMARILPRSSIFRCGCALFTAVVDPGYKGALTMGLKNVSDQEFTIERKARIAQLVFEEVSESEQNYDGKYQGGKVV